MAAHKIDPICQICLEPFLSESASRQTRHLSCGHTFCLGCLDGLLRTSPNNNALVCPNCRAVFALNPASLAALPRVYALEGPSKLKLAPISRGAGNDFGIFPKLMKHSEKQQLEHPTARIDAIEKERGALRQRDAQLKQELDAMKALQEAMDQSLGLSERGRHSSINSGLTQVVLLCVPGLARASSINGFAFRLCCCWFWMFWMF